MKTLRCVGTSRSLPSSLACAVSRDVPVCRRRRCRRSLRLTGTPSLAPPTNACRSWIRARPWLPSNTPLAVWTGNSRSHDDLENGSQRGAAVPRGTQQWYLSAEKPSEVSAQKRETHFSHKQRLQFSLIFVKTAEKYELKKQFFLLLNFGFSGSKL